MQKVKKLKFIKGQLVKSDNDSSVYWIVGVDASIGVYEVENSWGSRYFSNLNGMSPMTVHDTLKFRLHAVDH